jgi:hypothetical protein
MIQRAALALLEPLSTRLEEHERFRRNVARWLPQHRTEHHDDDPDVVPHVEWFDDDEEGM